LSKLITKLREKPDDLEVEAEVYDLLPLESLFDAEEQWCTARVGVLRKLASAGIHDRNQGWRESIHWSWADKAASCAPRRLDIGEVRLFGIKAAGTWQCLSFCQATGHVTRLGVPARPLVYVEYIETAPWNWDIGPLNQVGRYRGWGVQLMELAVRWSLSIGFEGRVGLHALDQAEGFYRDRCRMTNLGADSTYMDLLYLELSEDNARRFLRIRQ
jgi:hypothetical protein